MPNIKTYQELNTYLEQLERRIEMLENGKNQTYTYKDAMKDEGKRIFARAAVQIVLLISLVCFLIFALSNIFKSLPR